MAENKPKIYCLVNGGSHDWLNIVAIAEDGNVLAGHASSSEYWAKHDIGINSDWKHEHYQKHYPKGYELVWLDKKGCDTDEGFKLAVKRNQELEE